MAVKASRYLTHVLRLTEPEEPVELLVEQRASWARSWDPS